MAKIEITKEKFEKEYKDKFFVKGGNVYQITEAFFLTKEGVNGEKYLDKLIYIDIVTKQEFQWTGRQLRYIYRELLLSYMNHYKRMENAIKISHSMEVIKTPVNKKPCGKVITINEQTPKIINKPASGNGNDQRYSSRAVAGYDVIDMIKVLNLNFNEGNILKYLLRDKGEDTSDLEKIKSYAERELIYLKGK